MLKIIFFVPPSHLEQVKQALFAKGAGQAAGYSACCWQVLGHMQYKPEPQSHPREGDKGELVYTEQYRVEMICLEALISDVIAELKRVHPYEQPAYEITRLAFDPLKIITEK